MSKSASVFVLAEDKRQQDLIYSYFRARGFAPRQIRLIAAPVGETQNVGYVLKRYVVEVELLRRLSYTRGLVVAIDADDFSVEERKTQLNETLAATGKALRVDNEAIAVVVPRRNVETWLWHLDGNAVDETTNYKGSPVRDSHDTTNARRRFADYIVSGQEPFPNCPPSLQNARIELSRVPFK